MRSEVRSSALRWLHPAPLLLTGSLLFIAAHQQRFGDPSMAWIKLRVKAMTRSFADLRMITSAASCDAPLTVMRASSPCDHWHRAFNYPEIWLHVDALGITEEDTNALGIALAALFVLSIATLMRASRGRLFVSLLQSLAVCSPPIWYLLERGNCDILIFALLVLAGLLSEKRIVAYLTLMAAALLKVFPLVAFLAPALRPYTLRQRILWLGCPSLALASFALQLPAIAKSTDHPFDDAFGFPVLFALLFQRGEPVAKLALFSLILIAGSYTVLSTVRRSQFTDDSQRSTARVLFELGACTYLFTYLFTASYVYRLAPLLLTLPYLADLARDQGSRWLSAASLGLVAALFWSTAFNTRHHGYYAVFPAWVALLLAAMLWATPPPSRLPLRYRSGTTPTPHPRSAPS